VPVERQQRADAGSGPQTFRSSTGLVVWWVWLLFAAANLIDLAVQGRDHLSLVAAAILLMVTGLAYVAAQRPRVIVDDARLTIRNPLRDHRIGWAGVTKTDVTDLLRVHCEWTSQAPGQEPVKHAKVIDCWAVHYSRRRQLAAEARARRMTARAVSGRSPVGLPVGGRGGYASGSPADSTPEVEAQKIIRLLDEHATAARAEAVWAGGTVDIAGADPAGGSDSPAGASDGPEASSGLEQLRKNGWLDPLTSTWSWPALAALIVPALILLVVCLI
jgi:Bacterial PH domain